MLGQAFSFSGTLGRLRFLGGNLLCLCVVAVLNLPVMLDLFAHVPAGWLAAYCVVFGLSEIIGSAWYLLALQAKRVRDLGLEPAYVLPGYVCLKVADMLVAGGVPDWASFARDRSTYVGLMVDLCYCGALLLWPGRRTSHFAPRQVAA